MTKVGDAYQKLVTWHR